MSLFAGVEASCFQELSYYSNNIVFLLLRLAKGYVFLLKTTIFSKIMLSMEFKINAVVEMKESKTLTVGVNVTPALFHEIQRVKRISKRNKTLFNEYARQFFEQLIEKFDNGEFDKSA